MSALFPLGLEVSLHSVDSNRDAIDERERLRVLREHRGEHACENISKFSDLKANFPQADFSITDCGMHQSEVVDGALIQRSPRSSMARELTNCQSD